jgi:prepilin-type N-terminal cleavage/methylation domain-containing protein/prepilin-type processing-associated H-X9-DG protein
MYSTHRKTAYSSGFTSRKSNAFTLIELLVVIAIIAILAAILFPVFARARERARQTACLSNMKQIGTSLMMYTQDFDEMYPMRYGGGCPSDCNAEGRQRTWKDMLNTYIKSKDVFRCPSNSVSEVTDTLNVFPAGYAMYLPNGPVEIFNKVPGWAYPQHVAGVSAPANSLIIFETSYRYPDLGPNWAYTEPSIPSSALPAAPSSWYSGHSKKWGNMIYMDGHAKYQGLLKTFDETEDGLNQWRFSKALADGSGRAWFYQLWTDLKKYPNND